MENPTNGGSPVSASSASTQQNGQLRSPEPSTPSVLPIKIKDEPPDWTLNTTMSSQCCAGGMPIHSSPQSVHTSPQSTHSSPHNLHPQSTHSSPHNLHSSPQAAFSSPQGLQSSPQSSMYPPGPLPSSMSSLPPYPGLPYPQNGMIPQHLMGLGPPPLSHNMPTIKSEPPNNGYPMPPVCSQPGLHPSQIKQEPSSSFQSGTANQANGAAEVVAPKPKSKSKKASVKKEIKQEKITDAVPVKKKRDRFNGMSEEEVLKRTLPDHLSPNLDIVIVGINPGLCAAYLGHHYAGPGNHFWKCLYLSGLIPEPMNAYDDYKLKDYGIGFTNIVERTSRGSSDLTRKEIKEGGELLLGKIQKYKPKIAVFNGKGIYEVFVGHKNFYIGKQPEPFPGCSDTAVFVMPSSSARCSQLPRAVDKVPFYLALKRLRDYLRGDFKELDESQVTFPDLELKVEPRKDKEQKVKDEPGTTGTKKSKKRKSTDNEMLDNMAMNAMNLPHVPVPQGMHPPPPGAMGPPMPFPPPWQHPGLPGLPQLPPNMSGSQVPQHPSMENLFATPPVLVKQEDMSDLTNYGITPAMFSGQSYLGGCPAPQLPTVSFPGPWHNSSSNVATSSAAGFPQSMSSGPPSHAGGPSNSHSPAGYHCSSQSPHQIPNHANNGPLSTSYSSGHESNQSFPSPNYLPHQQASQNTLSPHPLPNGQQNHGPISPAFQQSSAGPQPFVSDHYQYNGSNGPAMGFG